MHLTRRARGLPFWFSLAVHGTDAYAEAVERTLEVTREGADGDPRAAPRAGAGAPSPSCRVVAFRRRGWDAERLPRAGRSACAGGHRVRAPHERGGETVARFALVNPRTTLDDVRIVLDSM